MSAKPPARVSVANPDEETSAPWAKDLAPLSHFLAAVPAPALPAAVYEFHPPPHASDRLHQLHRLNL